MREVYQKRILRVSLKRKHKTSWMANCTREEISEHIAWKWLKQCDRDIANEWPCGKLSDWFEAYYVDCVNPERALEWEDRYAGPVVLEAMKRAAVAHALYLLNNGEFPKVAEYAIENWRGSDA